MTARASMAALITAVRGLIGDTSTTAPVLTDDQVQAALDAWREEVRYQELTPAETIQPGGAVVTLDYYADMGNWETDAKLFDAQYNVLTPATSDYVVGHWTFTTDTPPPVRISGKTYDLYAAAADLLAQWAAIEKLSFDFSADGASYQLSQKVAALLSLAQQYHQRQRPHCARQVRSDLRY